MSGFFRWPGRGIRKLLLDSAALAKELDEDRWRAFLWGQIADIYFRRGQLDEALRIRQEKQLPVYEALKDVRSRAVTMGQIADILWATSDAALSTAGSPAAAGNLGNRGQLNSHHIMA